VRRPRLSLELDDERDDDLDEAKNKIIIDAKNNRMENERDRRRRRLRRERLDDERELSDDVLV
jgi:hypothetical protein